METIKKNGTTITYDPSIHGEETVKKAIDDDVDNRKKLYDAANATPQGEHVHGYKLRTEEGELVVVGVYGKKS